jgi:hypothetical protein
MKILMASHYFASHKGGIEIVAEELFRRLAVSEQEVTWLAADTTPPPDPLGRSRTNMPSNNKRQRSYVVRFLVSEQYPCFLSFTLSPCTYHHRPTHKVHSLQ